MCTTTDALPRALQFCDTSFSSGSLRAARRAAGAVTAAVDAVVSGRYRNAFCAVRPPGHHAGPNGLLEAAVSCGFCIFNNVAVGALHALETHGLEKVAIVDTDVSAPQEIVRAYRQPSKLLFYSVHLFDKEHEGKAEEGMYEFFPGSGAGDDTALNIINVPVQPLWRAKGGRGGGGRGRGGPPGVANGSGRAAFREAITARLLPALRAFNPQLILMSSGFDAVEGDVGNAKHARHSHAGCDLTPSDYAWITERVQEVADMCCEGRLVSVLEGGYGRPPLVPPEERRNSRSSNTSGGGAAAAPLAAPLTQSPRSSDEGAEDKDKAAAASRGYQHPIESTGGDAQTLDRSGLADAVAAHVLALVDPYRYVGVCRGIAAVS
ncbi:histone deacetylase domain-containing protein [Tribonema minus]|uniref:histone deacetylase n=1 Tax=Tribonema minus TaxID=303371 RepID=A0A835YI51_9STRA|nr:histone deacetylase domain-containing protein [Tribonema minus]